jgi:hypothetical protein
VTEAEVVADSDVVTGCKSGSEVRDTPPPGFFRKDVISWELSFVEV